MIHAVVDNQGAGIPRPHVSEAVRRSDLAPNRLPGNGIQRIHLPVRAAVDEPVVQHRLANDGEVIPVVPLPDHLTAVQIETIHAAGSCPAVTTPFARTNTALDAAIHRSRPMNL